MTQKQNCSKEQDRLEVFRSGPDGFRCLVQQVIQEVLESDIDEANDHLVTRSGRVIKTSFEGLKWWN